MWDKLKSESGQSTAEYVVLACIFVVILLESRGGSLKDPDGFCKWGERL